MGGVMTEDSGSFQSPPVKVLAAQLRQRCCRRTPDGPWVLERKEDGLPALVVSLVWMQGTVLSVEQDGSSVRLQDDSGTFVAQDVEKVPKGRPCLGIGKYVMVMGLVQSCNPEPVLRAMKISDLSGEPLYKSMWRLEVEDLQRNVA